MTPNMKGMTILCRRVVMSFTKKDMFKKKHDAYITNGILVIITRLAE